MKLTVLVDNNTFIDKYYYGEPAVSYYIEAGDKRLLFDTGYSDIFLQNAEKMGIDLSKLTHIVLSHGHNDHSNGLQFLAEKVGISGVELIAHPDCFLPKYDEDEYIGAPYSCREISEKAQYYPCKEPYYISENLLYLGEIPWVSHFEKIHPIGKQERSGVWEDDYVMDDTALVYKNKDGIFIITGCAHSGICNIIKYAKEVCNEQRILGVLGGFHLFEDDERLKETVEYLCECNIEKVYPCHCVSLVAKARMMEKLSVGEVGVGMVVTLKE